MVSDERWSKGSDQMRLFRVACILLVGWYYSKPSESIFNIVEGLDKHTPVRCNALAEPLWVEQWFFNDESELYGMGLSMNLRAVSAPNSPK